MGSDSVSDLSVSAATGSEDSAEESPRTVPRNAASGQSCGRVLAHCQPPPAAAAPAAVMSSSSSHPLTYASYPFLAELGIGADNSGVFDGSAWGGSGPSQLCLCPATGAAIARVTTATAADYERAVAAAHGARTAWAAVPAPARGEVVRKLGDALRAKKAALGALISLEMGKIASEGLGEVQEFIDVCDMACGMSRTIAGAVLPSERAGHQLLETWNPLGAVGVISAFNFPHAVFGWNLAILLICGDTCVWKGASSTSLVTVATARIVADVLAAAGVPPGVLACLVGSGREVGERMLADRRLPLLSFTGSSAVGVRVGDPLDARTLMGPLHTAAAVAEFEEGLVEIRRQGGTVLTGGGRAPTAGAGFFVQPTVVAIDHAAPIVQTELFVPILYVCKFSTLDEAIAMNNGVPQGLSSSLFTRDMRATFKWLGAGGSDCGIVNVNCGTSGAEIGGAFGGNKDTGGGRESGSDVRTRGAVGGGGGGGGGRPGACARARAASRRNPPLPPLPPTFPSCPSPGSSTCAAARARSTTPTRCRSPRVSRLPDDKRAQRACGRIRRCLTRSASLKASSPLSASGPGPPHLLLLHAPIIRPVALLLFLLLLFPLILLLCGGHTRALGSELDERRPVAARE